MYEIIKLDTEITNRCNAACPQCPRTGTNKGVSDVINASGIYDVPPSVIEGIFKSKYGSTIKKISYCGNYGDPIMHPKAMEIFKIAESNGVNHQHIDTNASVRPVSWWSELGKIKGMSVTFSIDGLEDTNHIYRVKTKWKRIMENAQAFIDAGGHAIWTFIVFAHNQHQVEEAKKISEEMGFNQFNWKASTRKFRAETPNNPGVNEYRNKDKDKIKVADIEFPTDPKFQSSLVKNGLIETPVKCMAETTKQLFLTSDLRILPCCHVQPTMWERKFLPEKHKKEPEFANFVEDQGLMTELDNYTFDEIVESYIEVFPYFKHAWDKRMLTTCNRKCGSNFKNAVQPI